MGGKPGKKELPEVELGEGKCWKKKESSVTNRSSRDLGRTTVFSNVNVIGDIDKNW